MSRELDIANGLQKKSTTAGAHRLGVVFLCTSSPLVSRRKAYVLNQGIVAGVTFLFRGRYSGQGFGKVVSTDCQTPLFSRVSGA